MKKDVASFDELQQDHARHWQRVGQTRDQRYGVVQAQLLKRWRCPECGREHPGGGICPVCRSARVIEIE